MGGKNGRLRNPLRASEGKSDGYKKIDGYNKQVTVTRKERLQQISDGYKKRDGYKKKSDGYTATAAE